MPDPRGSLHRRNLLSRELLPELPDALERIEAGGEGVPAGLLQRAVEGGGGPLGSQVEPALAELWRRTVRVGADHAGELRLAEVDEIRALGQESRLPRPAVVGGTEIGQPVVGEGTTFAPAQASAARRTAIEFSRP